ncbi:MAG TPA: hypothetical protein VLH86_01510 [Patescibacteria group bacterium]|nr:hypothetical protein [Patescibacteria group bacterium]
MDKRKKLKLVIIAALAAVTFLIVVILAVGAKHGKMGHLTINAAPTEITLTIDGKKVKNVGAMYIAPGDHKWDAKFANFTGKTGSFSIKAGEEQSLDVFLEPANPAGEQYLATHPTEASRIEGLVGKHIENLGAQAVKQTPLIDQLPYIEAGYEFRIDYGTDTVDGKPKVTIYIESISDQATQDALDWIKQQGTDPSTLTIVYSHREPDNYNVGHQ